MTINITKKLFIELSQHFPSRHGFEVINIAYEYECYGYELWVTILGCRMMIRYNTDKSLEQFAKWDKEATDAINEKSGISLEEFTSLWRK